MSAEAEHMPARSAGAGARSPYIVSPSYDWALFLLPPLLALVLGALIAATPFSEARFRLDGRRVTWSGVLIGTLIHAHLVAVFLRSHGNVAIFRRYRVRFVAAPLVLFAAMMSSMWIVICATVLVVFWDVYHSALQTFGLARIYDRNRGNDPREGRTLDLLLNHLLYAGPILAGATMLAHFKSFEAFGELDESFFTSIPPFMQANQRYLTWGVIGAGTLFLVYYVLAYYRLSKSGYEVSPLKVWLLASTGLCSIYTWGFNPWGQAFFIMNFFHAVQYFGLIWWSEGRGLSGRLRLDRLRLGKPLTAALFLGAAFTYGYSAEMAPSDDRVLWSITQVVALMHFWYDGFIWSVTREHV
jgi:hypothetical protein